MSERERSYPDDFDIKSEADKMLLAVKLLAELNLRGIVDVVRDAHTIGPIVDPTKYRDALHRGAMDAVASIADELRGAVAIYREKIEPVKLLGYPVVTKVARGRTHVHGPVTGVVLCDDRGEAIGHVEEIDQAVHLLAQARGELREPAHWLATSVTLDKIAREARES